MVILKIIAFVISIPVVPVTAYLYWKWCVVNEPVLEEGEISG